jgi:hypothetical protein
MKRAFLAGLLGATLYTQLIASQSRNVGDLLEEALAATNQIQYVDYQAQAMASLGVNLVRSGQEDQGRSIFKQALERAVQSTILPWGQVKSGVIFKIAEAGLFDLAQSAALSMPPSRFRDSSLAETAIRLAEKGQVGKAKLVVAKIESPRFRAFALNGIAGILLHGQTLQSEKRISAYMDLYKIPTDGK